MRKWIVIICGVALCRLSNTHGEDNAPPLTGRPWVDMDYGPFLSATLEVSPGNIVNKGIAIRLDPGPGGVSRGSQFVLFETDTLRYAAGWTGSEFINWKNIAFNGEHQVHASILGHTVFSNRDAPGWASPDGSFDDARLVGRDGHHYGPMPRDRGHWRGLYVHGDHVVLSYSVGDCAVLDMPGIESDGAFRRTLNLGPRSRDLVLQVAQQENGALQLREFDNPKSPNKRFAVLGGTTNERPFSFDGRSALEVEKPDDFDWMDSDFTICARIKTSEGGTILTKAPATGKWAPNFTALFVRGGKLVYDIGWVGAVTSRQSVDDDQWHTVVMTYQHASGAITFYIDGKLDTQATMKPKARAAGGALRIGFTTPDFPVEQTYFEGSIGELRFYQRAMDAVEAQAALETKNEERLLAQWDLKALNKDTLLDASKHEHAAHVRSSVPKDLVTVVAMLGGPAGAQWLTTDKGELRLKIPAGKQPVRLALLYWSAKAKDAGTVAAQVVKLSDPVDLMPLTKGGPVHWPHAVTTQTATIGPTDGPYVVEDITLPDKNPYRSWMRVGGFDFFPDGKRAAVCTWQGDVWIVDGLGGEFGKFTWRRVAAGLFQPLGLKFVDGAIYLTCRDQITVLRDLNGDGETDFYENFNNDAQVTEHFHEFATGLQTDATGNFYYAKGACHAKNAVVPQHGTLLMVSKDGSKTEIIASGFRAPNGVCVNGDGTFIVSDQEGHWTPENRINWVKPGGFYGYMMGFHEPDRRDNDFVPPVTWIHKSLDRSPAEQVWVANDKWGLPKGSLLSLSYGTGEIFEVLYEKIGNAIQGGVVRMPIADLPTGTMRGRFHPQEGQLYVGGLFGWSSNKTKPGGFYRVRYTGKPVYVSTSLHVTAHGVAITFSQPLKPDSATDAESYAVSRYQYRRTANYGSQDYKVSDPQQQGRDQVRVSGAKLSDDKKTVFLQLPDMRPCMQMEIRYDLEAADGTRWRQMIMSTINVLETNAVPSAK